MLWLYKIHYVSQKQNNSSDNILDEDNYVIIKNKNGGTINLIGTVHVSKSTRERVIDKIKNTTHDIVAIELDSERLYSMFDRQADYTHGEMNEKLGLKNILRKHQENTFGNNNNLLQPGEADMLPAVEEGINQKSDIALIDMSVSNLKSHIKSNAFTNGRIDLELFNQSSDEIIDNIKELIDYQKEIAFSVNTENGLEEYVNKIENSPLKEVKNNMKPIENIAPEIIDALIDERDKYMAGHLQWLSNQNKNIIAVMGRGHLMGVYNYLQNPEEIPDEYVQEPDWYNYYSIDIV